jgi:hypothetical protein
MLRVSMSHLSWSIPLPITAELQPRALGRRFTLQNDTLGTISCFKTAFKGFKELANAPL